uniref:ZP-N domain-containing protein n=1 Tax=Amphiprion percula TaxID=161767 RepID=A0A3P8S2A7_AMPPE
MLADTLSHVQEYLLIAVYNSFWATGIYKPPETCILKATGTENLTSPHSKSRHLNKPLTWTYPQPPTPCRESQAHVEVKRDFFGIGQLINPDTVAKVLVYESALQDCESELVTTEDSLVYTFTLNYNPQPVGGSPVVRNKQSCCNVECHYQRYDWQYERPSYHPRYVFIDNMGSSSRYVARPEENKLCFQLEAFRFQGADSGMLYITFWLCSCVLMIIIALVLTVYISLSRPRWREISRADSVCASCEQLQSVGSVTSSWGTTGGANPPATLSRKIRDVSETQTESMLYEDQLSKVFVILLTYFRILITFQSRCYITSPIWMSYCSF